MYFRNTPRLLQSTPFILVLPLMLAVATACTDHEHPEHSQTAPTTDASASDAAPLMDGRERASLYLLKVDGLTGEPLGDHPVRIEHDERFLVFASQDNADRFQADPEAFLTTVNERIIADQLASYPLDTCVVAGGKLGSMGEPVNHLYRNRLVRFCCAGCLGAFNRDPYRYLGKIDQAHDHTTHDHGSHDHGH